MDQHWTMGGFQPQPTHHHHQQQHHQPPQANQAQPQYMPSPDQEIALARSQMFESVHHLSTSLRNAANQCDNFVKVISRHHPSAAATAFASNVGADFLALASGNGLGGGGGGLHPNNATQAHHHHHHANNPTMTAIVPTSGTPGRKPMSKEEKKALRKERKANRDPNAPKRPPSAYLLFQNEIREDMRQQYKDLTYSEVLGKISESWKSLTEDQRKVCTIYLDESSI